VGQILLPLGAVTSTLLITLIMAPEVLTGFPTHMGGNDGLVHESFGFYRLIPLFTVFWVLFSRRYTITLKGLAAVALSLQALLFFYVPSGRYAYLAWLLVFLVFLVAFRESFLPWLARNYPESLQRLGRLPLVRGVREALASSRWRRSSTRSPRRWGS
jgi:hypothetical protein